MSLSFQTLRKANIARQAEWCPDQKPDLSFRANELAGETGEVIERLHELIAFLAIASGKVSNVAKKLERERHGWVGSRETVAHLSDELGDLVTCADLTAMVLGIDLGQAVESKFNAVSEKNGLATRMYPDAGFKLNKWIDDEIARHTFPDTGHVDPLGAAETARGAAVIVMTDKDTLIGNLRAAGYSVTPPNSHPYENFNLAINFTIDRAGGEAADFLRLWREGCWDHLDRDWPDWTNYVEANK